MARILVIEDEASLRSILEKLLRSAGHEVSQAGNGKEGLAVVKAKAMDLVITDIYMPERDGLETIRELREVLPGTPIIAMSGRALAGQLLFIAQKLGAFEVLQKPFTRVELLKAVEKTLGKAAGEQVAHPGEHAG